MNKAIWITWENQVRNRSMASILGAELFVFVHAGNRLNRYIICTYKTILTLLKERPKIVFVQNPSVFLNYLLLFTKLLFKYKLVSDAHFAGIKACNENKLLQKVLNLCNSLVDLVIVTNSDHERFVREHGGKAVVCEDPLPDIDRYRVVSDHTEKIVLFICSFDVDEPYAKAFQAAEYLANRGYSFRVSGNYKKVRIEPNAFPYVEFLGYLPENEFYGNLYRCSVVLDLTENENCLVCGAYEAMVAEKPLVTSDTKCLRNYFTKGTLFTNHNEMSIANAIIRAFQDRKLLKEEIRDWKKSIYLHQHARITSIYKELGIDLIHKIDVKAVT